MQHLRTPQLTRKSLFVSLGHPQESLGVSLGSLDQTVSFRVLADALEQNLDRVRKLLLARLSLLGSSVEPCERAFACSNETGTVSLTGQRAGAGDKESNRGRRTWPTEAVLIGDGTANPRTHERLERASSRV